MARAGRSAIRDGWARHEAAVVAAGCPPQFTYRLTINDWHAGRDAPIQVTRAQEVATRSAELLAKVRDRGQWISIAKSGWAVAFCADALLAHCDDDRELRSELLDLARAGVDAQDADAHRYAHIADRHAVFETGAQIFGTLAIPEAGAIVDLAPVADPAEVDRRRAAIGLEPIAIAHGRWRGRRPGPFLMPVRPRHLLLTGLRIGLADLLANLRGSR